MSPLEFGGAGRTGNIHQCPDTSTQGLNLSSPSHAAHVRISVRCLGQFLLAIGKLEIPTFRTAGGPADVPKETSC